MKKLLIIFATSALLLTGCSQAERDEQKKIEHTVAGTFANVTVIDKHADKQSRHADVYQITVERDNQKVTLTTKGEASFDAIQKGNVLTIDYNKDFVIQNIIFEKLEEEK